MIREALYHQADSSYCFSPGEGKVELRFRAAANDKLSIAVIYNCKYEFHLAQKSAELVPGITDGLYQYYSVTLHLEDPRLVYIFKITEGTERFYFTEEGLDGDYDFTDSHFTAFQMPYVNVTDSLVSIDWLQNASFYQIFIDRFSQSHDAEKPTGYINLPWGNKPSPCSFAGGDLNGITEKLDYIHSLGMTALYLTPIFSSPSNHKYDTWDYFEIDPMFGTKEDLRNLIKKAHDKGIRVVLDAVFNHSGEGFAPWQDVLKNGKKSKYIDWFCQNANGFAHFASSKYMPKLNTENHECAEYLLSVADYWTKEFHVDGWRLDVSDEVTHDFWRKFRKRVKAIHPDCAIIGENWHNAEPYLRGDQFDSVMNYAFTKVMLDYFVKNSVNEAELANRLNAILVRNTDTANNMMFNLLDNHDTHRFITLAGGDAKKLRAAIALGYLFPGSFCLYYGTENEMNGGYDPDCRRCFDWSFPPGATAEVIKKMTKLKKSDLMKYGAVNIFSENGKFILERVYQNEKIIFTMQGFDWKITGMP